MAAKKKVTETKSFAATPFKLQRNKAKASVAPVARPGDLKGIWSREFGVYRVRIVEVLGRKGSVLTFRLVGNPKGYNADGPFSVDLDDGRTVWGDLPSTAQLVEAGAKKRIGYLALNENWLRENVGAAPQVTLLAATASTSGTGGSAGSGGDGPKVPDSTSL